MVLEYITLQKSASNLPRNYGDKQELFFIKLLLDSQALISLTSFLIFEKKLEEVKIILGHKGLLGNHILGKNLLVNRRGQLVSSFNDEIVSPSFNGRFFDLKYNKNSIEIDKHLKTIKKNEVFIGSKDLRGNRENFKYKLFHKKGERLKTIDNDNEILTRENKALRVSSEVNDELPIASRNEGPILQRDNNTYVVVENLVSSIEFEKLRNKELNKIKLRDGECFLTAIEGDEISYRTSYEPWSFIFEGDTLRINEYEKILPTPNIPNLSIVNLDTSNEKILLDAVDIENKALRVMDSEGENLPPSMTVNHKINLDPYSKLSHNSLFAVKNDSQKFFNFKLNGSTLWGRKDNFQVAPGEFFKLIYSKDKNKLYVIKQVAYLSIISAGGLFLREADLEDLIGGGGGDILAVTVPSLKLKPPGSKLLVWGDDFGIAQDDEYECLVNTTLEVDDFFYGVLVNDAGAAGNTNLKVEYYSQPANGTVVFTDVFQGLFTYTPNTDFVGTDSFQYYTIDGNGFLSTIATVTIDVVEQETRDYDGEWPPEGLDQAGGGGGASLSGGGGLMVLAFPEDDRIKALGLDGEYALEGKRITKKNLLNNEISLFGEITFDRDAVVLTEAVLRPNAKNTNILSRSEFNRDRWFFAYITVDGTKVLPGSELFIENFGTLYVTPEGLISLENISGQPLYAPEMTFSISNNFVVYSQKIIFDNRVAGAGDDGPDDDLPPQILNININCRPGDEVSFSIYDKLTLVDVVPTHLGFGLLFNQKHVENETQAEITIFQNGFVTLKAGTLPDFYYIFTNKPNEIMAIAININVPTNNIRYQYVLSDRTTNREIPSLTELELRIRGNENISRFPATLIFREQAATGTISRNNTQLTISPDGVRGPTDDAYPDRLFSRLFYYDLVNKEYGLYVIWSTTVRKHIDFRGRRTSVPIETGWNFYLPPGHASSSRSRFNPWSIFMAPWGFPSSRHPLSDQIYVERVNVRNQWYSFDNEFNVSIDDQINIPFHDLNDNSFLGTFRIYRSGKIDYFGEKNGLAPSFFIVRLFCEGVGLIDYRIELVLADVTLRPHANADGENDNEDLRENLNEEIESLQNLPQYTYTFKDKELELNYCNLNKEEIYNIDYDIKEIRYDNANYCEINSLYLRRVEVQLNILQNNIYFCEQNTYGFNYFGDFVYLLKETPILYCKLFEEIINKQLNYVRKYLLYEINYCDLNQNILDINYEYNLVEKSISYKEIQPPYTTVIESQSSKKYTVEG